MSYDDWKGMSDRDECPEPGACEECGHRSCDCPCCNEPDCDGSVAGLRYDFEWRPIETAPRDGTPILACVSGYGDEELWPGRGPITVYWGTYHPNSPGKGAWRDGNGHRRPHLTHWMPLPEPPL
jgi:hypothetical protein